ncbi:MAG: hypothetical protein ACYTFG_10555 [Planctomycetota bacterium]|jgi:hypothetical protein
MVHDTSDTPAGEDEISVEGRDLLFGRIALRKGYVLLQDLEDSLYLQEREPQRGRIGEILVSRGLLTEEKTQEILEEIRLRASRRGESGRPVGEALFGNVAVRHGFIDEEEINKALRKQENLRDEGKRARLGEILVTNEQLTCAQVERILNFQGKEIMKCDSCGKHFNVLGLLKEFPCPQCGQAMRLPLDIPPAEVHGDLE